MTPTRRPRLLAALFAHAPTNTPAPVAVSNGLFTVTLDFGTGIFTGPARWLEIGVRTANIGAFTTLSPRQQLTPAPYALFAARAGSVTNGAITTSMLGDRVVTPAKLNTIGAAQGQALAFDGTNAAFDCSACSICPVAGVSSSAPCARFTTCSPKSINCRRR